MILTKTLLGAGCFWGIEEFFRNINGVQNTTVGYSGGNFHNPTYEDVCNKNTGHAEVVLIEFNESILSYSKIIDFFWKCHDPTQLNRQGPDIGSQYRSVIFFYSEYQKRIAENSKAEMQKKISQKVVTEIKKVTQFFKAEEYHQCYLKKNY